MLCYHGCGKKWFFQFPRRRLFLAFAPCRLVLSPQGATAAPISGQPVKVSQPSGLSALPIEQNTVAPSM